MIIKTKNSTYEIQDNKIRRLEGIYQDNPMGEDWVEFKYLHEYNIPIEEGSRIAVEIHGALFRTSRIIEVIE